MTFKLLRLSEFVDLTSSLSNQTALYVVAHNKVIKILVWSNGNFFLPMHVFAFEDAPTREEFFAAFPTAHALIEVADLVA